MCIEISELQGAEQESSGQITCRWVHLDGGPVLLMDAPGIVKDGVVPFVEAMGFLCRKRDDVDIPPESEQCELIEAAIRKWRSDLRLFKDALRRLENTA